MRRAILPSALLAMCLVTFLQAPAALRAEEPVQLDDQIEAPDCADVTKQAPYQGYGYSHIVSIENGCEYDLRCRVSTDVTPQPQSVRVEEGETELVVTRRGSPASEFQARVDCERD